MIRFVYLLRRLPKLSREAFQHYWRENHGPLVAKHSTSMRIRRYVQSHTIEDPLNDIMKETRGSMEPYDGVADLWWNNVEELAAAGALPEAQKAAEELLEDEKNFIDFSRSSIWFAYELPQVNPNPENIVAREESPIIKICFFGHHLPSLSFDEAQAYWRMNHGPLLRSLAPAMRVRRYIQVHRLPTPFDDEPRNTRGKMEDPFLGHAELWYDRTDLAGASATPEGARASALLVQDESKFVDFKRSGLVGGQGARVYRSMRSRDLTFFSPISSSLKAPQKGMIHDAERAGSPFSPCQE
jgi:uncharacterized protein (TIGR02118 family)